MTATVERRKARETGATVELLDAQRPGLDIDPAEGGRWVTYCDTHGDFCQHERRVVARGWLAEPSMWCDGCRTIIEARTNGSVRWERRDQGWRAVYAGELLGTYAKREQAEKAIEREAEWARRGA